MLRLIDSDEGARDRNNREDSEENILTRGAILGGGDGRC